MSEPSKDDIDENVSEMPVFDRESMLKLATLLLDAAGYNERFRSSGFTIEEIPALEEQGYYDYTTCTISFSINTDLWIFMKN